MPRKMGEKGWEVEEPAAAPSAVPASAVGDKDAAKVGEYRKLEKELGQFKDMVKQGGDQIEELKVIVAGQDDKLLQVKEFGITFNDDGVLIAPDVENGAQAAEGSESANDPSRV